MVKKDWDQFRRWLADSFVKMESMVNSTKQAAIVAASERRMQYEQLVAARLAEQRRIQEERVARELAEKAEHEKIEAEKAEALKKAAIEAKKAEAAGKAPTISYPRVDNLEKSVKEIKADQKEFKEALTQQEESQKETKNILAMIWDKINKQA